MAFYKSIYTGTEIDQRLTQATYNDAVLAGFEGSKEEFDAILGKLKKIADKAENSTQMESEDLETFNKNVIDAINELHRELQAKPDEQDVIDQGELEVFKDEIAAKYATKGEIEGDIKDVNSKISTINNNLVESVNAINKNVNDSLTIVNQAIQQNAETIVAEIEQRKEADKEVLAKVTEGDTNLQKDLQTLNQNLIQSINQINENVANGFNTINGAINDELRPNIENNKTNITQLQETVAIVNTNLYESVETINTALNNAINTINGGIATEISDRQNADTELDSKITQEISDRTAAIVSLDSTLRNEITQRKNADITLDSMIRQEMSNRQTADDQLSERIEIIENAGYQNADQVKAEIEKIIDAAPEALDTLKEIGDALNNDPDFAATMTNELSKKADKTDLDTKVDWVDYNNTKNIVLPSNGQIFGDFGGDESNSSLIGARIYNAGFENEAKQVEVGTSKVHLNLNSLDKPTIKTPDGKENLVVESDIELMPKEIRIPIRTLQDKVYTQEEILKWFGVEDIVSLKKIIAYGGIQYVKYGLSLSTNPHYYKMPVEYVAFESATQIKLVFVGLNTRDDVASKYEIIMNLDGTIIEGNSNVKMTITSIEPEDINLSTYATKEELNEYALKTELPDVSDFVTKDEIPTDIVTREELADKLSVDDIEVWAKSQNPTLIPSNKLDDHVVKYLDFSYTPSEESDPVERKTIQLNNYDSISGMNTEGNDAANLIMMSKWNKVDIGSSRYPVNFNGSEFTLNDNRNIAKVYETKALTNLAEGAADNAIRSALGLDFEDLIEIIQDKNVVIVDRTSIGDYKACIHATGNISSGNGGANLMFFIGTKPTIYQIQYVNGTYALAVIKYEFATKSDISNLATKDEIPEAYDDTQLRNELQQTETGVATANSEIEKLQSGKQSIQDETLQTTNKTIVGAINELLAKVQELETKNTELESRLAALEGTN